MRIAIKTEMIADTVVSITAKLHPYEFEVYIG